MKLIRHLLCAFVLIAQLEGVAKTPTEPVQNDFFSAAFKKPIFGDLTFEPDPSQPLLLLFFEPNCTWCLKQSKVLNLLGSCEKAFSVAGIGVNGNLLALKKMGWQLKANYPLYLATPAFLKRVPAIEATPTLLWVDAKGVVQGQHRGFLPFSLLVNQLSQQVLLNCAELSA
ncbi:MAG: hypothetical protein OXE99_08680 [Cellvibrionales bacterium]|nr:hypothetical protein [Cellvibrionales bacterium]